jgi:hypothetical protein
MAWSSKHRSAEAPGGVGSRSSAGALWGGVVHFLHCLQDRLRRAKQRLARAVRRQEEAKIIEPGNVDWLREVSPATFFASAKLPCPRCGQENDFGSSEQLYFADSSRRCVHCGFPLIAHLLRKIEKMREKLDSDPAWRALLRAGRYKEMRRRLDALVPSEPEGTSSPTSGNGSCPQRP